MRIVDVCAFYSPQGGGVRTYVEAKLKAGSSAGHEIVILAPGEDHAIEERGPGARIVTIPAPRFPLDRRYRYFSDRAELHAAITALRPDFLEASSPWRSATLVAEWPGSAPRALIMHADPLSAYAYRWLGPFAAQESIDRGFGLYWRHLRRLGGQYDCIISASRSLSRRLTNGGVSGVTTNPMGVDAGLFSPSLRDTALRARLLRDCGLPPEAKLLIGVGRHAPEKRWPMVIEAATAAGYHWPIGLMLIGEGRDRGHAERAAGENPHIRLLAPVRDRGLLARIMASADALIHGCEAETFCIVAAEARASGLPLIVPDAGGAADQASCRDHMYLSADAASAADAIARFASSRPAAEGMLAGPAQRTMQDHFSDLFGLYGGIIAGGVRRAA